MLLGPGAPSPAVIETLTGSPFGVQLEAGTLPLFDPYGWDPERGLDAAVELLGWRCARTAGGTPAEALDRLRTACGRGPVLAGPLDMGLLLHQPGTPTADGGDHYVVVLAADGDTVLLHDPHGHPYVTLPSAVFLDAWRGESVPYTGEPFVLRDRFVRERHVPVGEALRRSLPRAVGWLAGRDDLPVRAGTLGGRAAVERLASLTDRGLDPGVRAFLTHFAVRVGARRLADAADCLAGLGLTGAAEAAAGQARALGAVQYPLVVSDDRAAAEALRRLAPGYDRLHDRLRQALATAPSPAPPTGA
ncbi:hypothetical protein IHE55_26685 [Streptomyces pactum]|uniref:Uncharacterized protein n=1 Tax=Streptomyces pactum TaxID=68249 RepID=A0ABS0NSQ9_9ACTN|nr:hypothetical protein [Streptomyces pactum]MBH5338176.1 hypothetical protein [Streptomyces pactum]